MSHELDCPRAREELSARLDGELPDDGALRAHLAVCGACRAHERRLVTLAAAFAGLRPGERAEEPVPDLWPRIERRATAPRAAPPLLVRLAAGLLAFLGLGAAAWLAQRGLAPRAAERHLFERVSAPAPALETLFASLPEYQLLHTPPRENER